MTTPTTSSNTIYTQINWASADGQGQTVTQFSIQIKGKDGSWNTQSNYCPGTNPSLLTCNIPFTVLRATPFNLMLDDYVVVRVSAKNSNGWGPYSDSSSSVSGSQI